MLVGERSKVRCVFGASRVRDVARYTSGGQAGRSYAWNAGYVRGEPTICLRFRGLWHPKPQTKANEEPPGKEPRAGSNHGNVTLPWF